MPSGKSVQVPLKRARTVIGRQTDCHVRIPANDVSRNHCEVMVAPGSVAIADMGSRNGTFVNRERVQKRALDAGDKISVGPAVFVVQIDGEPAAVSAQTAYAEGHVADPGQSGRSASRGDEVRTSAGMLAGVKKAGKDDSSLVEFEFDLDDDDDAKDQPPL